MEQKYDVLLVGAGLFNAVLAHKFATFGKSVLVVERREDIGGNCYTEPLHGIDVHKYGAHIFHTSNVEAWEFANKFAKFNQFVNSPVAMTLDTSTYYPRPKVYNLPFNMNTFNELWGCATPDEAKRKIEEETRPYIKAVYDNLEEKALSMVGKTIYEKVIKGYTEKQWHCRCDQLHPDIISRIPLRFNFDNNYFNDTFQGIPEHGYTEWIRNMLSDATVITGVDYLKERDKWDAKADLVFFSGMVDEFFNFENGRLHYRSLEFRTEVKDTGNYQGVAVVNYPGLEVSYTRTIEHRHFMSSLRKAIAPENRTIVTTEYPADMKPGMEAYYPVADTISRERYGSYMNMRPRNVVFTGRLGRFEYNDMDDTIIKALAVAEEYR